MIPYLRNASPWFAFLVHLRGLHDADRVGLGPFLRRFSCDEATYAGKLESLPPVISSEIRFRSTSAKGDVICVNRLPERMAGPEARREVLRAAHLGIKRGARMIGLGALTSPATGGGLTIVRDLPAGVAVTNGNALTAAIVRRNVVDAACSLAGTKPESARIAIVGCTGSVGSAVTRLLADAGYRLILIGRNRLRVEREFSDLVQCEFSGSIDDIQKAHIILLLTSDPSALITADQPPAGSAIIDCAQPPNIDPREYPNFAKRNIAVFEGGIVRINDYSSTDDFGFSDPHETFACLAETYILARSGNRQHYVGRCSSEDACHMERLATRYAVQARPFQC
jgi:fatty aldehyde-generating acyl-ACP reductase